MASTYYYLEEPILNSEVLEWFRSLDQPPVELAREQDFVLFFKHLGELAIDEAGAVDSARSPAVILRHPKIRRGVLWTAGEVHFLTKRNAPTGAAMAKIQKEFQNWLYGFPQVFGPSPDVDKGYYLEGSIQNRTERVLALPSAMQALERERYFVDFSDNDFVLDRICQKLKLRGVNCT